MQQMRRVQRMCAQIQGGRPWRALPVAAALTATLVAAGPAAAFEVMPTLKQGAPSPVVVAERPSVLDPAARSPAVATKPQVERRSEADGASEPELSPSSGWLALLAITLAGLLLSTRSRSDE